jgi:hypothetical protein
MIILLPFLVKKGTCIFGLISGISNAFIKIVSAFTKHITKKTGPGSKHLSSINTTIFFKPLLFFSSFFNITTTTKKLTNILHHNMSATNVMRAARKITKSVLSREQMDGVGAKGKHEIIIFLLFLFS